MVNKHVVFTLIFFSSFTLLPTGVLAQSPAPYGTGQSTDSATLQENRQEIRASREAVITAKRKSFQQKVATIKDERKRQIIERIDNKLSTVNTNRTSQMSQNLEKLSSILAKIQERATIAQGDGKDISTVASAITKAETAIQAAKTAVEAQAGNEYVITITATGSAQLKNSVGIIIKQLQANLSASHKLVVAAKQAVQTAHMTLAKILETPVAQ